MAACGGFHTLVVTEEGVVWAFGGGAHGRLGLNGEGDRLVPRRVDPQRFGGAQVATVAAGGGAGGGVGAPLPWALPACTQKPSLSKNTAREEERKKTTR